jgi:hypothetical protein
VLRLLDQFPPELQRRSGRLAHIRCLCAWARWDWPNMREAAERPRRAYESDGDRLSAWRAGLYEAISYGSFGFTDEARSASRRRRPSRSAPTTAPSWRWTRTYQAFDEGRLDLLGQRYGEVLDALESSTTSRSGTTACRAACSAACRHGPAARRASPRRAARPARHADAAARARAGAARLGGALAGKVAAARRRSSSPSPMRAGSARRRTCASSSTRVLPILHALHGRAAEARAALDELMKTFDDPDVGYRPGSFVHVYYSLHRVRIADLLGDGDAARALFAEVPDDPRPLNETMRASSPASRRGARPPRRARRSQEDAIAGYAEALADADALSVYGQTARCACASRCCSSRSPRRRRGRRGRAGAGRGGARGPARRPAC